MTYCIRKGSTGISFTMDRQRKPAREGGRGGGSGLSRGQLIIIIILCRHDATKIMHFCWTHNLTDKVHKMNAYGEMHVTNGCMMQFDDCDTTVDSWDKICVV